VMQNSLAIIGAGRVGRKAVRFIGAGHAHPCISRAIFASRVILIATPDDQISAVASELARIGRGELPGKVVLHTSGARNADVLSVLKTEGAAVGSMHPLQSFSGVSVPSLEGRVFAIDGDSQAIRVARQMARALGGSPVRIASDKKALYHTAAAMAAGHVLAVEEAATQLLVSLGMRRSEAVHALLSLTRQVLDNFEGLGPRAAWTGPLSRGDFKVVQAHLRALRESPREFANVYVALSRLAARALAQDPVDMLAELEKSFVEERSKAKATGGNA
jgi:predicted short-subunit dehydrogenase-like oxidoreductase (DUF2520 family)